MKKVAARLSLLGLFGLASLLLIPLERVVPVSLSPALIRLLGIIQPALLMIGFTALGAWLAPKVGLDAPVMRAWAEKQPVMPVLRRQLPSAILVGLIAAAVLVIYDGFYQANFVPSVGPGAPNLEVPLITGLLYGGIVEELIMRWGAMSLFVWLLWKVSRAGEPVPGWCYWLGAVLAALLFAAGHLPLLFSLHEAPPAWLLAAIIGGNTVGGILFGWLFWKQGLEASMMAHALAHLFGTAAITALAL